MVDNILFKIMSRFRVNILLLGKRQMYRCNVQSTIFILLAMLFSVTSNALIQVSSDPSVGSAMYVENNIDLRVKVANGYLDINRYFGAQSDKKFEWTWNRRWRDLILSDIRYSGVNVEGLGLVREYITRGKSKYELENGFDYQSSEQLIYYFQYDKSKKIIKTEEGYTWSDRNGDWINYNPEGEIVGYGDRSGNEYELLRNSDSTKSIAQVKDQYGNVLVTFTYANEKVSKIEDYAGRKVEYIWDGDFLKEVIDERGHRWKYTYQDHYDTYSIETVTDPEGNVVTLEHRTIQGGFMNRPVCNRYSMMTTGSISGGGSGGRSYCIERTPRPTQLMLVSKIDAEGIQFNYNYHYDRDSKTYTLSIQNSEGVNVSRTTDPDGKLVELTNNGQVTFQKTIAGSSRETIFDAGGNQTLNTLDQWKQITKTVHPDGTTEKWEYHPSYDVVTKYTDKRGVTTLNEYDDKAQLIRTTKAYGLPEAQITEYTYNEQGLIEKTTYLGDENTATAETNSNYDNYGNEIEFIDAEGNKTEYLEYDVLGNYHKMKDAKGNLWLYEYDLAGNLTKSTTPMGFVTGYVYDKNSNMISETLPGKSPKEFGYNKRNQLNKITINNSVTGEKENTKASLRADGKVLTITDAEGNVINLDYDGQGKLIQAYDALGNTLKYEYDYEDTTGGQQPSAIAYPTYREEYTYDVMARVNNTVLVDGENSYTTNSSYDENGNLVEFTDPKGRVTKSTYDLLNRLASIEDAMGEVTQYQYDFRGNLVALIDPKLSITRFQYDKNNKKLTEIKPLGQILTYTYNPLLQPATYTDNLNQMIKYGYDNNGRQIKTEYFVNPQSTSAQKTIIFNYDNAGWLTGYNDDHYSGSYVYDDAGRLLNESTNFGSFTKTLNYTYYKNDKRHTYSNGENLIYTYRYDQVNRFTSLELPNDSRISVNEYQWDAPSKTTYPGGTKEVRQFDGLTQLEKFSVLDVAGNTILNHEYSYDAAGNVKTQATYFDNFNYSYDDLDRLSSATGDRNQEIYTYDSVGNRLTSHKSNDSSEYNANHQLNSVGGSLYLYDENGRMIQRILDNVTQEFTYDIQGRLQKVSDLVASDIDEASIETTIATYTYDPFGRRLSKNVSGVTTYFLYGIQGLMAEYDEQGNPVRNYNYWPDSNWGSNPLYLEQMTDGESEHYFYHNDHLGTPQVLSNAQGGVVWRAEYTAFGEVSDQQGEVKNYLGFPGQYSDKETSLSYNYFRYYDPDLGRYIQTDPAGFLGGINTYAYVGGNPLYWIDPLGLSYMNPANPNERYTGGGGRGATSSKGIGGYTSGVLGGATGTGLAGAAYYNKPPSDAKDPDGAKAPGKPGEAEGFVDPKKGEQWVPNPNPGKGGGSHGWKDRKGRVWIPTGPDSKSSGISHGGSHWDVQLPSGKHINVPPGKHIEQCM